MARSTTSRAPPAHRARLVLVLPVALAVPCPAFRQINIRCVRRDVVLAVAAVVARAVDRADHAAAPAAAHVCPTGPVVDLVDHAKSSNRIVCTTMSMSSFQLQLQLQMRLQIGYPLWLPPNTRTYYYYYYSYNYYYYYNNYY